MEKEFLKGSGLPVPAGLQKGQETFAGPATPDSARRRKQFRFLAAFVFAVLLGFAAFSFMRKSLELASLSYLRERLNPDARGKLTVQEAESMFL